MMRQEGNQYVSELSPVPPKIPAAEEAFLARLRAGEPAAAEEFVRRFGPRLLSTARRFLRSEADCEDAVQDAFIQAFRALHTFEGASQLGTWLHRILVNNCLIRLRAMKGRHVVSVESLLPTFDGTGHYAQPVSQWVEQADKRLEDGEVRQRIRDAIELLPESYRTVLLLRDIEELDTRTTAELLELTDANVKARLHRARQALRVLLDPLFGDKEIL